MLLQDVTRTASPAVSESAVCLFERIHCRKLDSYCQSHLRCERVVCSLGRLLCLFLIVLCFGGQLFRGSVAAADIGPNKGALLPYLLTPSMLLIDQKLQGPLLLFLHCNISYKNHQNVKDLTLIAVFL